MLKRLLLTLPRNLSTLQASLSACMALASATFCLAGLSATAARTTWPEWSGAIVIGLGLVIAALQFAQRQS